MSHVGEAADESMSESPDINDAAIVGFAVAPPPGLTVFLRGDTGLYRVTRKRSGRMLPAISGVAHEADQPKFAATRFPASRVDKR